MLEIPDREGGGRGGGGGGEREDEDDKDDQKINQAVTTAEAYFYFTQSLRASVVAHLCM